MSFFLKIFLILSLPIFMLGGCLSEKDITINTGISTIRTGSGAIKTLSEASLQSANSEYSSTTEQESIKAVNKEKMRENIMSSSAQCLEIRMPQELEQYLNSKTITNEQKKNIQEKFNLSIQRCTIRAAVRENTECSALGELSGDCEKAKKAASFIKEYEMNRALYQQYFGDPGVVSPAKVLGN